MKHSKGSFRIEEFSNDDDQMEHVDIDDLMQIPKPLKQKKKEPEWTHIAD